MKRMAVRSSPWTSMSRKAGIATRSIPPGATYPRAMPMALTVWLTAPAPIACTSQRPVSRIMPAMAPATEAGLDLEETLSNVGVVLVAFDNTDEPSSLGGAAVENAAC